MILIGIGIVAISGAVYAYDHYSAPYEVVNEVDVIEKEVVKKPDWATDPDAVQAAKDVIRRKELEAQETQLVEEISAKQDELDAVRKELGTY